MSGGFTNKPKILRGAFVEYGLSIPPLIVPFQFNPVQLVRNRSLIFSVPNAPAQTAPAGETGEARGAAAATAGRSTLRQFHQREEFADLLELQRQQQVQVGEENITFDIRLDATDRLNDGDPITEQFGIMPQLCTLELMVYPKSEGMLGAALGALLGSAGGFSFTRGENPPMILFIWGRKRVLPVNINSMNITETEFSTDLNPIRASVAVNLTVIEGPNPVFKYSKAMKEVMSVLNVTNLINITDVVIPG
ncbi:MAG: hypothetical protein C4531_06860 [Desulfurivibrio sp.]|nr:MAG: hypothetical protein C4531_06860 [Desulfurivibrio sp.]